MVKTSKQDSPSRKGKRKKKRWVLGLILVGLLGLALFLVKIFFDITSSFQAIQTDVTVESLRDKEVDFSNQDPFSVLLLGTDTGIGGRTAENDGERSDTMIIATINPKTETTTLVSIPRDSYVNIVGYGYNDKINHAYAFGGARMAINTVQKLFNIPIDYYVKVDMQGLKDIVDALGGIDITSPLSFTFDDMDFKEGQEVTMDGMHALAFARMRYDDPEGDVGRQLRQRLVIEAIAKKALSLESLANYQSILKSVEGSVQTNLSLDKMLTIQSNYRASINHFEQETLSGEPMMINEIFYFYLPPEEILRVSNVLRTSLNLPLNTEDDLDVFKQEDTEIKENVIKDADPVELEKNQVQPEYIQPWTEYVPPVEVPQEPVASQEEVASSSSWQAPVAPVTPGYTTSYSVPVTPSQPVTSPPSSEVIPPVTEAPTTQEVGTQAPATQAPPVSQEEASSASQGE